MELTATEGGGLRRMDVREAGALLDLSLAFPASGISLQPPTRGLAKTATCMDAVFRIARCFQPFPSGPRSRR